MESITLYNGVDIPILGYRVESEKNLLNMMEAIKFGYRLFEIRPGIGGRKAGALMAKSGVLRHELFLASVVGSDCQDYQECQAAVLKTLKDLQTDYLDLVLLEGQSQSHQKWAALEDLYEEGILRVIGINSSSDLSDVRIKPMISIHKNDDQVEAVMMISISTELKNGELDKIAMIHHKTKTQIMIRWALQKKIICMISSTSPRELVENQDVSDFCLSPNEMKMIDLIEQNKKRKETRKNEENYYFYFK